MTARRTFPDLRHSRRGDALKALLIALGIFVVVVGLLCCGGGVAGYFWFTKNFGRLVITDPVAIRQLTTEITEIDIPSDFRPAMGSAVLGTRTVMYAHSSAGPQPLPDPEEAGIPLPSGSAVLTLMSFESSGQAGGGPGADPYAEQHWTAKQLRQMFTEFTQEVVEHTVRGQVCKFQLIRGKQRADANLDDEPEEMSDDEEPAMVDEDVPVDALQPNTANDPEPTNGPTTEVWWVRGHFPGKTGPCTLTIMLPTSACDAEALKRIVQSIR